MTKDTKEHIAQTISRFLAKKLEKQLTTLDEAGKIATICTTLLDTATSPADFNELLYKEKEIISISFVDEISRKIT